MLGEAAVRGGWVWWRRTWFDVAMKQLSGVVEVVESGGKLDEDRGGVVRHQPVFLFDLLEQRASARGCPLDGSRGKTCCKEARGGLQSKGASYRIHLDLVGPAQG